MPDIVDALLSSLGRFRGDRRGTIAIQFALLAVPMVLFAGLAIDYAQLVRVRTVLNGAADSAVLATVATQSQAYTTATGMSSNGSVTGGATEATGLFNAETVARVGFTVGSVSATVTKSNGTITATLQYTAQVPTSFMRVVGINTMTTSGSSSASNGLVTYIDFYLLLDNSPSMAVAATTNDIATMVANTPDQCAFACHDLSLAPNDYYGLAQTLGVTTRIAVLRSATQQLMTTATTSELVANEFRMAIYTTNASSTTAPGAPVTISSLTTNLSQSATDAAAIDVEAVPYQNYISDQYTNLDAAISGMNTIIPNPGTGYSSASPQKVLFFVSDGVNDYAGSGGRTIDTINLANCTSIKNKGIQIAVLYTTYLPLPTNAYYNAHVAPFDSTIGPTMQSCASPGLYFEVSPSQGISEAMQALFLQVVQQAHLTQ
jgi:Flp pilus assembly protein TadG